MFGIFVLFGIVYFVIWCFENFGNIQAFFGFRHNDIMAYNAALDLAKNGHFERALAKLPASLSGNTHQLEELRGDILYSLKKEKDEVIGAYHLSLNAKESSRVQQKIRMLQESTSEKSSQENQTEEQKSESQQKLDEILKDQKKRQDFLRSNPSEDATFVNDVRAIEYALKSDTIEIQRDW